jgi:hypothetical protein
MVNDEVPPDGGGGGGPAISIAVGVTIAVLASFVQSLGCVEKGSLEDMGKDGAEVEMLFWITA